MKVIYAFVRSAFHDAFIYRLDFWTRQIGVIIMMYASYSLWSILYRQSPNAFGMDLERMTTYGMLGMLLYPVMDSALMIQWYIEEQVRMGTLELDLMKPLDFFFHMLGRSMGFFGVTLILNFVPGFLFGYFFLGFNPPMNLQAGLAFSLSLFLGFLVFFMINFLMGMVSIVTLNIRNISWAFMTLVFFTSGQMVPLWMFPPALAAIIVVLPFKDVYFIPMSIYIGAYDGGIGEALLSQLAWIIMLFTAARIAWWRVQRRITVQGG